MKILLSASIATCLIGLPLYLWRVAFAFSDWAILALIPLVVLLYIGFWPLTLAPWTAKLRLSLREESPLNHILTGRIRATLVAFSFSVLTTTLLAWQVLEASLLEASYMLALTFISGSIFSGSQTILTQHFHQPFARSYATSLATWMVALPFTLVVAVSTWSYTTYPGALLDASFQEALQLGWDKLPARNSWGTEFLSVFFAYTAGTLWAVIELREYPWVAAIFSLDNAFFCVVLSRSSIIVTQFIQSSSSSSAL